VSTTGAPTTVSVAYNGGLSKINTITWDWPTSGWGYGWESWNTACMYDVDYYTSSWHDLETGYYPTSSAQIGINYDTQYNYRVRLRFYQGPRGPWYDWSAYKESGAYTVWGDELAESISIAESVTDSASLSDSFSESIYISDGAGDATIIIPLEDDFTYYYGSYDGKLYEENYGFVGDYTSAIDAYYLTPQNDFSEVRPEFYGRYKTVYMVRLWYVDVYNGSNASIGVSIDGGSTWESTGASIGNGDGTVKYHDFYLISTGATFMFKVQNDTNTDRCAGISIEVFFKPAGPVF